MVFKHTDTQNIIAEVSVETQQGKIYEWKDIICS